MSDYDGSHLGAQTTQSAGLLKTACNLLEHCEKASLDASRADEIIRYFETRTETRFEVVGETLFTQAFVPLFFPGQAYVLRAPNKIVIAFRGSGVYEADGSLDKSMTAVNAMIDLHVKRVDNPRGPGRIHTGFSREYERMRDQVIWRLEPLRAEIESGYTRVYITGFSLGGALATLCANDVQRSFGISPYVFLFASPGVGDRDFNRSYTARVPNTFRFADERDVIAQLPQGLLKGYAAQGEKLFVFDKKSRQVHHTDLRLAMNPKIALATPTVTVMKLVAKFMTLHKPSAYQRLLIDLHVNYPERRARGSNMRQASDEMRRLSSKHAL